MKELLLGVVEDVEGVAEAEGGRNEFPDGFEVEGVEKKDAVVVVVRDEEEVVDEVGEDTVGSVKLLMLRGLVLLVY